MGFHFFVPQFQRDQNLKSNLINYHNIEATAHCNQKLKLNTSHHKLQINKTI